jgi:peptidoglycan/LPS O-acetylase OafA/YrhL
MNDSAIRQNPPVLPPRQFSSPQASASVHLDALRGIAAFSVLLAHWRIAFFVDSSQIAKAGLIPSIADWYASVGFQWVMVFFVLSGYLVGGSVLRSIEEGRWSWGDYLLARLTRLYVVLFPALILGAAFDWIGMNAPGTDSLYSAGGGVGELILNVRLTLTLPVFLENAAFLEGIRLPGSAGHMAFILGSNISLWSLVYEFWYYIAFPIAVMAFSSKRSWRVRLTCGLALLLWVWFVGERIALFSMPWLIGVLIHYLPRIPDFRPWARRAAMTAAAAAMLVVLPISRIRHIWAMEFLVAESAAVLVWVIVNCGSTPMPAWYNRLARRAAKSSYTLYLVHLPFLIFVKAIFHVTLFQPKWRSVLPTLAVLAATLVYGQIVYELFEKHTDGLRSWIKVQLSSWLGAHALPAWVSPEKTRDARGESAAY